MSCSNGETIKYVFEDGQASKELVTRIGEIDERTGPLLVDSTVPKMLEQIIARLAYCLETPSCQYKGNQEADAKLLIQITSGKKFAKAEVERIAENSVDASILPRFVQPVSVYLFEVGNRYVVIEPSNFLTGSETDANGKRFGLIYYGIRKRNSWLR